MPPMLANHQYIQKQINNLHIISEEEFLSYFQSENNIKKKQKKLTGQKIATLYKEK
jgi:hypothetical protein